MKRARFLGTALLLAATPVVGTGPAAVVAQEPAALADARGLLDAGRLAEAEARLRVHLAERPGDVDARWLLAQTLYWRGRLDAARAEYLHALADRPEDSTLRLDAARFLVETGRARESARVLAPLVAVRDRLPPGLAAETRRLEIEAARGSAPYAAVRARAVEDDQPLGALEAGLEAGWWPGDGMRLALSGSAARLEASEEALEGDVREIQATVEVRRPGAPVEVEVAGGASARSNGATEPVGRLALALALPAEVRLRAEGRRWRYLWTARSLEADLLVESFEVLLDRGGHSRWAGQIGARLDRFPDDNRLRAAWGWVLAPLLVRPAGSLRAGYAFESQDAEETRFDSGRVYDPYYTPEDLVVHSVVAAADASLRPGVALRLDGAVGVHARERAPRQDDLGGIVFDDREFRPWRARARLEAEVSAALGLALEAEHHRSAFFRVTRGAAGLTLRFPR